MALGCYFHWMPSMGKHIASAMEEAVPEAYSYSKRLGYLVASTTDYGAK
jgi:hypothetical protein